MKAAAGSLGLQVELVEARAPDDFDGAFALMANRRVEAILVVADALSI